MPYLLCDWMTKEEASAGSVAARSVNVPTFIVNLDFEGLNRFLFSVLSSLWEGMVCAFFSDFLS